jgi:hypothetical protein
MFPATTVNVRDHWRTRRCCRCCRRPPRRREPIPDRAHPVRGNRVHEPLADDLRVWRDQHRPYRNRNPGRGGTAAWNKGRAGLRPQHAHSNTDGRRVNVPVNIVVFDCRMGGNWGAITCGSELTALYVKSNTPRGGFARNVMRGLALRNCQFNGVADTSNALAFVDGLVLNNVNINGKQIGWRFPAAPCPQRTSPRARSGTPSGPPRRSWST